jgi:uncharacterized protein DUF6152
MKSSVVAAGAVAVSVLVLCGPAFAHHGAPSLYDVLHPITIKGTVTEFVFANPHAQIYLDVKSDKGEVVQWSIETNGPGQLRRAGWTRETLKPGDTIAVTLIPAKNGAPVGFSGWALGGGKIVLANGQTITTQEKPDNYLGSDPRAAPQAK